MSALLLIGLLDIDHVLHLDRKANPWTEESSHHEQSVRKVVASFWYFFVCLLLFFNHFRYSQ